MSIHDNVNNLRDAERALIEAGFTGREAWVFINTCLGAGLRIRNGGGQYAHNVVLTNHTFAIAFHHHLENQDGLTSSQFIAAYNVLLANNILVMERKRTRRCEPVDAARRAKR